MCTPTPSFVQFGCGKYSVSDNLVQFNSTQIYLTSRIVRQYNKFCTKYEVGLPERRICLWIPMITGICALRWLQSCAKTQRGIIARDMNRQPVTQRANFSHTNVCPWYISSDSLQSPVFLFISLFYFFCVCMWVCAWLVSSMNSHCYNRWPAWWALQLFW